MGDPATRQCSKQMLNGGNTAGTQVECGAELTVTHLVRRQPDRVRRIREADVETGRLTGSETDDRLFAAVEADPAALDLINQGPGPAVVLRPVDH